MVIDSLDVLAHKLAIRRSGWHRVEGPGGSAFFPVTAKDVDAWESRATAQAAESEAMARANRLTPKPEENALAERKRQMTRGD